MLLNNKALAVFIVAIVAIVFSLVATLSMGTASLSFDNTLACLIDQCESQIHQQIIWELRWPRILLAFVAGGALAVAGAMLQNATGNPLAEPYLFGLISGASLGAIVHNMISLSGSVISLPIAALVGGLFALILVVGIYKITASYKSEQLILIGVSVSFMLAAISQFLLYVTEPLAANRIVFWLMGSVANNDTLPSVIIATVLVAALILTLLFRRHIDALLLGEETASSLGVNTAKLRLMLLIGSAVLTSFVVAFCGGIGFVGLMIPHIVRRLGFTKTASLAPLCIILGGLFLVWVDLLSRISISSQEIPIGIVTAALGSVFFLLLVNRKAKL